MEDIYRKTYQNWIHIIKEDFLFCFKYWKSFWTIYRYRTWIVFNTRNLILFFYTKKKHFTIINIKLQEKHNFFNKLFFSFNIMIIFEFQTFLCINVVLKKKSEEKTKHCKMSHYINWTLLNFLYFLPNIHKNI